MPSFSIKIDLAASLRFKKHLKEPDPSQAAVLVELAGADGVCCHLREDRRHIRDRDIYILKEVVRSKFTVQIAPDEELLERVLEVKPNAVILMPFMDGAGFDIKTNQYESAADSLKSAGIKTGYFIKPEMENIKAAARARADLVIFDCFDYVTSTGDTKEELDRLEQMAQTASKLGISIGCGGGLDYRNIRPVLEMGVFEEFIVGHAVISRGLMVGLDRAVREMSDIVHSYHNEV